MSKSDVIIAGGGVTGLVLGLALARVSKGGLRVALCAPGQAVIRSGPRTSAIAAGPRRMLEALGVWGKLAASAQPISEMQIGDVRTEEAVRKSILGFEANSPEEPLGHMVFHRDLEPILLESARDAGVDLIDQAVVGYDVRPGRVDAKVADGRVVSGRLIVAADGAGSRVRACGGIKIVSWPYDRLALVATISHEREHGGRAVQYFFPGGPFAVLPVVGRRSSIVWTERTAVARALLALSTSAFIIELKLRLGEALGPIGMEEGPSAFPLAFQIARTFTGERLALVGDAAHRVHPLAGQGLNLGLRDVATLVETILAQARLGLDIGAGDVLADYGRRRHFDTVVTSGAFDALHRIFEPQSDLARAARSTGLAVTDLAPAVKRYLEREASGLAGDAPQLFG